MNAVDELNLRLGIGPSRPCLPISLQRSGYTAVRQLGKGSFGNAYLVFHAERKQYYVVKHVNMANMTTRQRRDAHQEIVVLQQLEYPNIIRYVEFCEEHPHLYIVMEYADGGDVYTHLKNLKSSVWALGGGGFGGGAGNGGGLTEEQVISLFVQTTMAVKYMHDRRLLHRDIKSQNVFLTKNHVVKLGDFGISTVLMSTVAMAQTMCGTPCYFSPELCQGKPYNNKSDVWALGILLYELCTAGRLPFEASTMNRLMDEICKKEPRRIPAAFSDELWNLVLWMLKKDPRQRPDAGQILRTPVLVRAIPNIIKTLSAADGHSEDEYKCVLSGESSSPPPPIRPAVDVHFQQLPGRGNVGAGKVSPVPGSAAAAGVGVVGGGGGFLHRRNDEYPFRRENDLRAPKDRVGNILGMLVQQQRQLRKQREDEEAIRKVLPTNQPILADAFKYVPALLQAKENQKKNNANNKNKNDNGMNSNAPSKKRNLFARPDVCPERGCVDERNVKEENNNNNNNITPPQQDLNDEKDKVKQPPRSIGKLPLQDLFLLYDEGKRRINNERENRLNMNRKPMNYQPSGLAPFNVRPLAAGANAGPGAQKMHPPPALPHRPIYDNIKAVAQQKPKEEEKPIPISAHAGAGGCTSAAAAAAAAVAMPARVPELSIARKLRLVDDDDKNDNIPLANEPRDDLALVLREMTNHFESVCSSAARSENVYELSGAKGKLETSSVSGASNSLGPEAAEMSPTETPDFNLDDGGEEFSDAMGTTLNVQDLQRKPPTPLSLEENKGANGGVMNEIVPLSISRYEAVWPPRYGPVLTSRHAGSQKKGDETNSQMNTREFRDDCLLKQGPSSTTCTTVPDAAAAEKVLKGVEAKEEEEMLEGGEVIEAPLFTGGCLCDGVRFTGLASTVYGSFVCNCVVCSRFSGAMMGVEWLHLPDVSFEDLFDDAALLAAQPSPSPEAATIKPLDDTPAGNGVSAAQALAKANSESSLKTGAIKGENRENDGNGTRKFPPSLKSFIVEVPLIDEDNLEVMGFYVVYFCGQCGSTIGMCHNDIAGGLVAKAVLSDASLATLESFQKTMTLGTGGGLIPRGG